MGIHRKSMFLYILPQSIATNAGLKKLIQNLFCYYKIFYFVTICPDFSCTVPIFELVSRIIFKYFLYAKLFQINVYIPDYPVY